MAGKDKLYRFLNPVWLQDIGDTLPLAPRPTIYNGKEIYFSITGELDTAIPLEKRLRGDYPVVKWKVKKSYNAATPLLDAETGEDDGLIQGVAW